MSSEATDLTMPDQNAIAPVSESATVLSLISHAASDPNVDMDKMERLMTMRQAMVADEARKEYTVAMSDAQAEMRPVSADAHNPQTRSKYATYAALDNALRPIYTKHGFYLSFGTFKAEAENCIGIECDVSHNAGHTKTVRIEMPADGKGAKGGDVMTKTHAVGSASSYGQRYLLKMIFNVAIGEADDDGNGAGGPVKLNMNQAAGLIRMEHVIDEIRACKTFRRLRNMRDRLKTYTFLPDGFVRQCMTEFEDREKELDAEQERSIRDSEQLDEWSLIAQMLENCGSADELSELWESERVVSFMANATQEQSTSLKAQCDLCAGRFGG